MRVIAKGFAPLSLGWRLPPTRVTLVSALLPHIAPQHRR
jgi:hypothetical protein